MIIIDLGKPGIEKNKTTVPQIILKIITILEIKKNCTKINVSNNNFIKAKDE